jgi:phenylpropionate dioxygenase-like ring-hydroxylating dioxygenase large terminal subunit
MPSSRPFGRPQAFRPDFVPPDTFRGPDVVRLEKERLWPRVWQKACREEELTSVGSFVNYVIMDDSILIVRTGEGPDDLVAYYNVCQHRGRRLKTEPRGQIGHTLTCRFHGWRWTREGELDHVHMGEDWEGCPEMTSKDLALPRVKLARWGGWIWINQDENAESLESYLGEVIPALDPFEPENMRALWWKTVTMPANWKIVIEAFNEAYHIFATHTGGVNYRSMGNNSRAHGLHSHFFSAGAPALTEYRTTKGNWKKAETFAELLYALDLHTFRALGAMVLEPGMAAIERLKDLPADTPIPELLDRRWANFQEEFAKRRIPWPKNLTREAVARAGTDWHIFPNSIILPTVDGAIWYRMRPNGDDHNSCIVDVWSFGRFPPGEEPKVEQEIYQDLDSFKGQCEFLEEDFVNLEAVNLGVKSRGWRGARTSPRQEVPINHFRKTLTEFLNMPPEGE